MQRAILYTIVMCFKQEYDSRCSENSTSAAYDDQLSSSVTAAPPSRPLNCGQLSTFIQLPIQRVETGSSSSNAFGDTIGHLPATSDTGSGNSRDSWSSTSSNVVVCQPVPADHQQLTSLCAPQQLTQHSRHVQLQQCQMYNSANRHWRPVETTQSVCRQYAEPHHSQHLRSHATNLRSQKSQAMQHPYTRCISSAYPHHLMHRSITNASLPLACCLGMRNDISGIEQVHWTQLSQSAQLITQQQGAQHSVPGSAWIGTEEQSVTASPGLPQITHNQRNNTSPASVPWYRVDDQAVTAILAEQGEQQTQRMRFNCVNPRPQSDQAIQHQYQRSTSSVHPYQHRLTHHSNAHLPSAWSPGMRHDITGIQQVHGTQSNQLINQLQHAQQSIGDSNWISTKDRCVTTSSGLPSVTCSQLNTSSQTLAPWYRVDDQARTATTAEQDQQQQQQQQHAGQFIHNSSNVSLSNNLTFRWSPDAYYENNVNNW